MIYHVVFELYLRIFFVTSYNGMILYKDLSQEQSVVKPGFLCELFLCVWCTPDVYYYVHVHHERCIQLHMVDYQAPAICIFAAYILE